LNKALNRNQQRAIMQWLTRQGPFWEDSRIHSPDDWFEVDGRLVTDSAIGEAAGSILAGIEKRLISLTPSAWLITPIPVIWAANDASRKEIQVINYWEAAKLDTSLAAAPTRIISWPVLRDLTIARCSRLSFSMDAFSYLDGHPFNEAAANRLFCLINILNRFSECFNEQGERTEEGQRLYQDFFTGKKGGGGMGAIFSDSSDGEKAEFRKEMTFIIPSSGKEQLLCSWHGKIQTPTLRFHFSFPIRHKEPVYVCYIGPKITKR